MTRRISAMRQTFGLMLTIVELVIGLQILAKLFCSDEGAGWMWQAVGDHCGQFGHNLAMLVMENGIAGQISFLILVMAFMIFTFTLMTSLPIITDRKEKRMSPE